MFSRSRGLAVSVALISALALTACPKNGSGGGGGGGTGGGDVGGGGGDDGGTGGGGGGMDSGVLDAGTCVKTELGTVDVGGFPVVKLATGGTGAFWAALSADGISIVRYAGGAFDSPISISDAGTLLEHTVAASDTDAVVAWTESAGAAGELHYANYDGSMWTIANSIVRTQVPTAPTVATAGGRAFLVWNEATQQGTDAGTVTLQHLYWQRFTGGNWEAPQRLDPGDGGVSIAAATADQTGPVAFWSAPTASSLRLYISDLPAAGNPGQSATTGGGYALLAAGNHAAQTMALVQQGDSTLSAATWTRGGSLGASKQVTLNATAALSSLALLDDGSALATWLDSQNKPTGAAIAAGGSAWIPFTPADTGNALVATDGTRVVQVTLGQGSGKLKFLWYDASSGWSTPLELPAGIAATQLNAIAFTSTGALALDVAGTVNGGAQINYAVVCH